jgi:DNA-binding SARP family transcriptional activator
LYIHLKEIFQKEYGILPSPKTEELYKELLAKT